MLLVLFQIFEMVVFDSFVQFYYSSTGRFSDLAVLPLPEIPYLKSFENLTHLAFSINGEMS